MLFVRGIVLVQRSCQFVLCRFAHKILHPCKILCGRESALRILAGFYLLKKTTQPPVAIVHQQKPCIENSVLILRNPKAFVHIYSARLLPFR